MPPERKRASRLEILGAWLHVWTPPRDVEVPTVPWRRVALIGIPVLLALAGATWLVLEEGSKTQRANEATDSRDAAKREAARRAELLEEQAVHRQTVDPAPRPELVQRLEAAVLHDAQARFDAGDLRRPVRRVHCQPHPRSAVRRAAELDPDLERGRYHCLAVTRKIVGVGEDGALGYPFLGAIVYDRGALVWCKITPVPGEQLIADPRTIVELPKPCR